MEQNIKRTLKNSTTSSILCGVLLVVLLSCGKKGDPLDNKTINIKSFYVSDSTIAHYDSIRVTVILPSNYANTKISYPVLYFLPGYDQTDDVIHDLGIDSILNRSFNDRSLEEFILVTYDNQNDNYTNWEGIGRNWSDFIGGSLIQTIDKRFRTIDDPNKRGIYGVSMGGEDALFNGLRSPKKFGVLMSHSAAIHLQKMDRVFAWTKPFLNSYFGPIYGTPLTQEKWEQNNLLHYLEGLQFENPPKIYFDVGVDDHLKFNITNIMLDEKLNQKLVAHTFRLNKGGHGNTYYKKNIPIALRFWNDAIASE